MSESRCKNQSHAGTSIIRLAQDQRFRKVVGLMMLGLSLTFVVLEILRQRNLSAIDEILNDLAVSAQATYAERGFYPPSVHDIGYAPVVAEQNLDFQFQYRADGQSFAASVERQGITRYIDQNGVVLDENFKIVSSGRDSPPQNTSPASKKVKMLYSTPRQ